MEHLDKRTIASRENGKLGGPKTLEGALRSSANSYKHGLYARRPPVLSTEDRQHYEALTNEFFTFHNPRGIQEIEILGQLVNTTWRYQRYEGCQEWMLELAMADQAPQIAKESADPIPHDARHTLAVHKCLSRLNTPLRELSRLLDRLQRQQQRLLAILKDLQGPRFNDGAKSQPKAPENHGNEPTNSLNSSPQASRPQAWTPVIATYLAPELTLLTGEVEISAPPLVKAA